MHFLSSFGLILSLALLVSCQSAEKKDDAASQTRPRILVDGTEATVNEDGTVNVDYKPDTSLNARVPDWVINPAMGGVTGSVGAASTSLLGVREQLDAARFNARLELASMLELRVQRIMRSELEENTRAGGAGDSSAARRDELGIDKEILDVVLAGARQRALWWDVESGDLYVWMVVDGAVRDRVDQAVRQGVSVFTASVSVPSEYSPTRKEPTPPQVIVQMPEAKAKPEAPKTPVEELESSLKPIETIPTGNGGGGDGN